MVLSPLSGRGGALSIIATTMSALHFTVPQLGPLTLTLVSFFLPARGFGHKPNVGCGPLFTFEVLLRPGSGGAPVRVRPVPVAVCVLLSGAGPPGLLRGRWRSAAVLLPSSGGRAGF